MLDTDYSPWPEAELKALARWHEQAADAWKPDSNMRRDHERRAQTCREALKSQDALRERCLIAEMRLAQALRGNAA